ncbi:hypothetical protein K7432_000507 [Basidiobolus ranarum]|uniref:BHLH domain-containing protein n=1 Tax=Basidiobolus ranarum TaxID=34480 RepID=A0ABR2X4J1_9FUNG
MNSTQSNNSLYIEDINSEETLLSNSQLSEHSVYLHSHTTRHPNPMEVGSFNPLVPLNPSAPMDRLYHAHFPQENSNFHPRPNSPLQPTVLSQSLFMDRSFPDLPMRNSHQRRLALPVMGQMSSNINTNRRSAQLATKSRPPTYDMENGRRRTSTSSIASNNLIDSPKDGLSGARGGRRSKKATHELLTEEEKRANHIASEQKRRQNIRIGFERLVDIVPTLNHNHRAESVILEKSVEYIHHLLATKQQLKQRVRELQMAMGEMNDDLDDCGSTDDEIYY